MKFILIILLTSFSYLTFAEDIVEEDLSYTFHEEEVELQKTKKRELASDIEEQPATEPTNGRGAVEPSSSAIKFWKY